MKYCPSCNAVNYNDVVNCRVCGASFSPSQTDSPATPAAPNFAQPPSGQPAPGQQSPGQPIPGQQPYGYQPAPPGQNPYASYQYRAPAPPPTRQLNHVVAGLLALFTGAFGGHKLYLKRNGQFVLYLLFCWTTIPFFVSILEGIRYFCLTDAQFQESYGPKRPINPNIPAPTNYYR